jgi:cyclophilin family peptidyl-prolyl cis-trans isomerase
MKPLVAICILAGMLTLAACVLGTPTPRSTPAPAGTAVPTAAATSTPTPKLIQAEGRAIKQYAQPPSLTIDPNAKYTATIRTSEGAVTLELFSSQAPKTVNNFIFLAHEGFYNGAIFHRVIPGFMIQGGDPFGTGAGGPGYRFGDEIVSGLAFDKPGVLAMANAGPNTNGSQFFITVAPTAHLTGAHTIFGRVIQGQGVVDAITRVRRDSQDRPLQPVVIQAVEVARSGGR